MGSKVIRDFMHPGAVDRTRRVREKHHWGIHEPHEIFLSKTVVLFSYGLFAFPTPDWCILVLGTLYSWDHADTYAKDLAPLPSAFGIHLSRGSETIHSYQEEGNVVSGVNAG